MTIAVEGCLQIAPDLVARPLLPTDYDDFIEQRMSILPQLQVVGEADMDTDETIMATKFMDMYQDQVAGTSRYYAIEHQGRFAGDVGVGLAAYWGEPDVSYWLGRKFQRQGLARQAVRAVCDYTFATETTPALIFLIRDSNIRSRKVAQAQGALPTHRFSESDNAYRIWRLRRGRQ